MSIDINTFFLHTVLLTVTSSDFQKLTKKRKVWRGSIICICEGDIRKIHTSADLHIDHRKAGQSIQSTYGRGGRGRATFLGLSLHTLLVLWRMLLFHT